MHDGDLVRMNEKYFIDVNDRGKVFMVKGEPYISCGKLYVKLAGYPAGYAVDGLEVIDIK